MHISNPITTIGHGRVCTVPSVSLTSQEIELKIVLHWLQALVTSSHSEGDVPHVNVIAITIFYTAL